MTGRVVVSRGPEINSRNQLSAAHAQILLHAARSHVVSEIVRMDLF